MTIVNILPGSNGKPAYIEFQKDEASRQTLLSVENFRCRFGDDVTNEVLGIEPEIEEEPAAAEEESFSEGLFSAAS